MIIQNCNNIPENPWQRCEWKSIEWGSNIYDENKKICEYSTLYLDADKDLCKKKCKNNDATDVENLLSIFDEYNFQCKQDYIECKYYKYTTKENC